MIVMGKSKVSGEDFPNQTKPWMFGSETMPLRPNSTAKHQEKGQHCWF
jgi:hypothetical protein